MRILIRTSKWAIWARRLASLAVPLAVLPVLMHRFGIMTSNAFHLIAACAVLVALLAFFAGLIACIRLWFTGDRGWNRAIIAMVLGLLCLSPVVYGLVQALHYPHVTDVSTDLADRPPLVDETQVRHVDVAQLVDVENAFPNARTRRYPLSAPQLFSIVTGLVDREGWTTIRNTPPAGAQGDGQVNAEVTTIIGWKQEVAVRVRGDMEGSSVAMRSASTTGLDFDLGSNGTRIEEFLLALDDEVTRLLRDAPVVEDGDVPPVAAEGEEIPPIPAVRR